MKLFHISIAAPNFKKRQLWFLAKPQFIRCRLNGFRWALFNVNALETATFTLNRAPSKSVEMTPYELWFGKKPKLSFLKVWGCDAYVKKLQPDKLEPKSEKCVFIGYPKETVGYTFYHRFEGKTFVAKNGSFLEKEFLSKEVSGRKVELDKVICTFSRIGK